MGETGKTTNVTPDTVTRKMSRGDSLVIECFDGQIVVVTFRGMDGGRPVVRCLLPFRAQLTHLRVDKPKLDGKNKPR